MKQYRILSTALLLTVSLVVWSQEVLPEQNRSLAMPKLQMPQLTPPMSYDSLRLQQDVKMNSVLNAETPHEINAGAYNIKPQTDIVSWQGGAIYGSSEDISMPALMRRQGVAFNAVQQSGALMFNVGFSANKYAFPMDGRLGMLGMGARQNQFSVNGAMTYEFSPNLSATLYGRYVTNQFYYSMAAFPYIGTSSYGGFFSLRNGDTGLDLGVNRYYDPFARRWRTDPIVRPKFKVGKIKMDFDVGPLVKQGLLKIFGKQQSQGPIIMPHR